MTKTTTKTMTPQNDNDSTTLEAALKELKMQIEVNRRLARELINVRLELEQLKLKHGSK